MTGLRFQGSDAAPAALTSLRQVSWRTEGAIPLFLFAAYPLWWAAGLAEMIWPIAGLFMAIGLLRAGRATAPLSFGLYIAFVLVVTASGVMLELPSNILAWAIRLGQYIAVGLIVPYVLTFRHAISPRLLIRALGFFWIGIVAGGWLGLILGDFSFTSPFAMILPAGVESNEFVRAVVNPSFADIETTYNVNNDDRISALDALIIINALSAGSTNTADAEFVRQYDSVWEQFGRRADEDRGFLF